MHYIAISTFSRDIGTSKEIVSRRRHYVYPDGFKNVQSFLDVQGGRAIVHFETDTAEAIHKYTTDWPELSFNIFPVLPSETAWKTYLESQT